MREEHYVQWQIGEDEDHMFVFSKPEARVPSKGDRVKVNGAPHIVSHVDWSLFIQNDVIRVYAEVVLLPLPEKH